jgi:4-amino-4-deoxy-L-arabinose transferase-like glycosyltransferase
MVERQTGAGGASPFLRFLPIVVAIPLLFTGLGAPAFLDFEGRYAEVAKEMLLTGDWVTPRLNFAVFLNKPPFPYWLTALTFFFTGQTEYARVWSALVGVLLLIVTVELGRALVDRRAGMFAGVVLLTSGGFFFESRLLRPDLLMTLCLSTTLLGVINALNVLLPASGNNNGGEPSPDSPLASARSRATWWLTLSAASLGVSILTKGMVDIVLASGVIGGMLSYTHRWILLRQIRWRPLFLVLFVIVAPWHVLVGAANQGFWWDYIVNQHFLFFFDNKFPRDSLPDSLAFFWSAFFGRTLPWGVCLPFALSWAVKQAWTNRTSPFVSPLFWLGVVLGFFSLSPSRLEHYSVPALPAAALLIGCWWSDLFERNTRRALTVFGALILLGLVGVMGFVSVSTLFSTMPWTRDFPLLTRLAQLVCGAMLVTSCLAGVCFWQGASRLAFILFACCAAPLFWSMHRALIAVEPINSWKPIGIRLAEALPPDGEAAFAASDEYQICGGLNFYSGKRLWIVLPEGYAPPTYLVPSPQTGFLTRAEFFQRWQGNQPIILVIDPERAGVDSAPVVSAPVMELGRWGERIMVANRAFAERTAPMADSRK